jgi:hypothetical protein
MTVSIKIVTLVTALFLFIFHIAQEGAIAQMNPSNVASIVQDIISTLIIFMSVDMPVKKVSAVFQLTFDFKTNS